MKVAIESIRALMVDVCQAADVPDDKVDFVVDHYLAGELRGKSSHGVAKFCFESRFFSHRKGAPRVVRERGALAVVDAQREIGPVSAGYAVEVAMRKAREFGAGIVGMINTQRYGILAQWSERIALNGFIGVAMNTSRAESTAHGGRTPFLGVNPLSFAFPTLDEPFVADMSTTLAPMGVLWESRRSGDRLPRDCFVDGNGDFTDDPDSATSAVVFGEHRGFAVSLLVQILTGSLFGFPMSSDVDSTWRTDYTFIALDPSFGGLVTGGAESNTKLVNAMRGAVARDGGGLRVPGLVDQLSGSRTKQQSCSSIDVQHLGADRLQRAHRQVVQDLRTGTSRGHSVAPDGVERRSGQGSELRRGGVADGYHLPP